MMLERTPDGGRDHDAAPWWWRFLDSSLGRGVLTATIAIVAAITIYGILATKSHITTVGPTPRFLR